MRTVIFTNQHAPDGHTIRYNVNKTTRAVAVDFRDARMTDNLMEVENENGGEPLFVNPDHVATVSPAKED